MKRLVLFICTILCANVLWAQTYDGAFYVEDLIYAYNNSDQTAVVYGYDYENPPTNAFIYESVIYQGVTYNVVGIEDYAFFCTYTENGWEYLSCSSLTSVTIPNSVISIGNSAFYDCSSLTSVTIPNSVTSIDDWAFGNCSSLTSVNIPNSITSIGNSVFDSCVNLTSVTIPNSVTSIGEQAFLDCSSLTSVSIGNSVTSIGNRAFRNCTSLTSVNIGNSVTSIGDYAFGNCSSLTSIDIPNSVTSIGDYAFNWCESLTSVNIGNSVTSIGNYAFSSCSSLTSVNIPNSVTSIGDFAFAGCSSLTSVNISNSVTSIGDYAFDSCSSLTSIDIPNSVTSIGGGVFYNCSSLTSVNIPNSVTSIGTHVFFNCSSLTSVEIPNSLTSIGYAAFYNCSSLTSVEIPNSVSSIGDWSFGNCSSLTSVTIPNSITSIGNSVFDSCVNLTSVNIPNSVTSIGEQAFLDCSSLTSITIPNSVTSIGNRAFRNCTSLTSVNIGNSVTSIGDYAFGNCSSLTSVDIPNSVTSIGYAAFGICSSLTFVNIPNSVNYIGNNAFRECSSLSSVTLPENATISTDAFYDSGITANDTIDNVIYSLCYDNENIGNYTFEEVFNITFNIGDNVYTPSSATVFDHTPGLSGIVTLISAITYNGITYPVTSIDKSAFYGCESLDIIDIPNSVTSIDDLAFGNCSSLTSVTCLANTPPYLGDDVFYNTPSNKILNVNCGLKDDYISSWTDFYSYNIHEIPFVVNATANDEAFGSVAVEGDCSSSTLTATANNCYQFVSWNDGNTDNPRIVNLTSDTSFVANFGALELSSSISATICEGQVYTENGFNVSEAGVYTQNLTSINGCDSIVTLTLNVNPIFNTELIANICEGQTYTENGFNVSEAGVYTQTLTSVNGCDSIVTLTVSVNPTFDTTINATINTGETYAEFGFNESEAGTYVQNLQTEAGCDSTITLNLTVNSSLYDVAELAEITFYPNPTSGKVSFNQAIEKVEVIDISGKTLQTYENANEINIETFPAGVYHLRMTIGDKTTTRKIIKE